ncbi:MAG: type III pantothenate kinase [Victivallaceae bacterium]
MLIVMNVGNTNTQIAEYQNGEICNVQTVKTGNLELSIIPENVQVAASTVVPKVKKIFAKRNIFWLSAESNCNIDLSKVDASTLGCDRLANIINLADNYPLPAICIDFGTAITFDLLDAQMIFRGGAIAPGRFLLRKALHDCTALLPMLPISEDALLDPGINTRDAMRLGMDRGALGTTKEIIHALTRKFEQKVKVIGIGGDAEFFINNIDGIECGGKNFTLKGIAKAWELNQK